MKIKDWIKSLSNKELIKEGKAVSSVINDGCFGVSDLLIEAEITQEAVKRGLIELEG